MGTLNVSGDEYHTLLEMSVCLCVCQWLKGRPFSLICSSMRATTQSRHVCSPSSHSVSVPSVQTGGPRSRLINTSASLESCASDQSHGVSKGSDVILIRYAVWMLYRPAQNTS